MNTKQLFDKALELLIVKDGQQPDKHDDKATRPLPGTSVQPGNNHHNNQPQEPPRAAPPSAPDQPLKIEAIYQLYGVQPAPFTAEQMLEVFDSLGAVPAAAREQNVRTFLESVKRAFGATQQSIMQDASHKLRVLAKYVKTISDQTETEVAKRQKLVDALQIEIDKATQEIEQWRQKGEQATRLCREHVDRLKEVVVNLGGDVSASDS